MKTSNRVTFSENITTIAQNKDEGTKFRILGKSIKLQKIQEKLAETQNKIATVIDSAKPFKQPTVTKSAKLKQNITRQINSLSNRINEFVLSFRRFFSAKKQPENTSNSTNISPTDARIDAQLLRQEEGLNWAYTRVPFKSSPPSSN